MRTEIELLLIGFGGALGAIARFGIAKLSTKYFAGTFPVGTLIANLVGCFLIGVILGSGHAKKYDPIRLGVGVGFLGALTTFSTFGAETVGHFNEGDWPTALSNVFANLVLGLVFVFLGMLIGKKFS